MGIRSVIDSFFSKKMIYSLSLGATCFLVVCALLAAEPQIIRRLDRIVYDIYLRGFVGGAPSEVPILVDIDENSIAELGQWPWPRYRLAELLTILYESGASSIAVDILMSEPDRTSPALWAKQIADDFGIEPDVSWLPGELMNNDEYLASIVRQMPVVFSAMGSSDPRFEPSSPPHVLGVTSYTAPGGAPFSSFGDFVPKFEGLQMPVPELADAASGIGLMNAEGDEDSVFRRIPLFGTYNKTPIPGLALATLALGAGEDSVVVRMGAGGPYGIRVAGIEVPVSGGGTLPIAFRGGGGSYPVYSAVDVLNGEVPQEKIAGRVVFLGSTSAGLLDLRPTPFDNTFPGLELHAAAVDTILSGRFIMEMEPLSRILTELLSMLLTGLLASALFSVLRPHFALPVGVALAACVWFGFRYEMVKGGIYITPLYTLINMGLQAFSSLILRFWLEEREKRVLRKAFSNYVSPEIVGQIVRSGSVSSLQGEQRNISVLFTDLRGFTSLTEKMAPTQVVGMLGSYFSPMTAIVRDSMGTLDKFVGDALMAFWNAPLDVPDHPSKAVLSLIEMQRALGELNETLEPEYGVRLKMGGGIHTGFAHVGNMGTADLMDYTAIGDTVNTASRLEGLCSKYGVGSIISKNTADLCEGERKFAIKPVDLVRVKGRSEGIPVFTVLTLEDEEKRASELRLWEEAFASYIGGDFSSSGRICRSLLENNPDEKLYKIFAERTELMSVNMPENWDGVFAYETK